MAEYALAHAPAWNTVYASQIGDGTATFWANSFLPLWGRFCNVARYLVSSGTVPTSGPSLDTQGALVGDPDGTTLIGWSGFGPTLQSTLRGVLETIITQLVGKVGIDGSDTMTGTLVAPNVNINNAGNTITLASRSKTVTDGSPMSANQTQWIATSSAEVGALVNTAVALPIELFPPNGAELTTVEVWWQGAGGHGALPATMPQVEVYEENIGTGVVTQLGPTATDSSASVAAYQLRHAITVSGFSHVVNRATSRFYVKVYNEGGVNALAGATYKGLTRTCTYTRLDEG